MCPYTRTVDGYEMQFGVNHLGRRKRRKQSACVLNAKRSVMAPPYCAPLVSYYPLPKISHLFSFQVISS